jgi:hypothetical protein
MAESEELWIPLVDEPIGELVTKLQDEDPELAALVATPRRQLAFRTFAYIRVGMLLGQLLVDQEVDPSGPKTWVEQLLEDPKHRAAVAKEIRAVGREVADDPKLAGDDLLGPDEAALQRFQAFARGLGYEPD